MGKAVPKFTQADAEADFRAGRQEALLLKGAKAAAGVSRKRRPPADGGMKAEYYLRFDAAVFDAISGAEAWDGKSPFAKHVSRVVDNAVWGSWLRSEGSDQRSAAVGGVDKKDRTPGLVRDTPELAPTGDTAQEHRGASSGEASPIDQIGEHSGGRGYSFGGFSPWGLNAQWLARTEALARFEEEHPSEWKLVNGVNKAGTVARYVDQQRPEKRYSAPIRQAFTDRVVSAHAAGLVLVRKLTADETRKIRREGAETFQARAEREAAPDCTAEHEAAQEAVRSRERPTRGARAPRWALDTPIAIPPEPSMLYRTGIEGEKRPALVATPRRPATADRSRQSWLKVFDYGRERAAIEASARNWRDKQRALNELRQAARVMAVIPGDWGRPLFTRSLLD